MDEEIDVLLPDGRVITVTQRDEPLPVKGDPVLDATWVELQEMAQDDSRPDLAMRASERLTDLVASRMNGGKVAPVLNRITVGAETIILDAFDKQKVEDACTSSVQAIKGCVDHDRKAGIKCQCLSSFREMYYGLQQLNPTSPLCLAIGSLWDRLDAEAKAWVKPKETESDATMKAVLGVLQNLEAREERPSWLGSRSQAGLANQRLPRGKNNR